MVRLAEGPASGRGRTVTAWASRDEGPAIEGIAVRATLSAAMEAVKTLTDMMSGVECGMYVRVNEIIVAECIFRCAYQSTFDADEKYTSLDGHFKLYPRIMPPL
jgi:hypothetical protein